MNKNLCFSLLLCLVVIGNLRAYDWSSNPGNGSELQPYQISTSEQLLAVGLDGHDDPNVLDKCFILVNDIDLSPMSTYTHAIIAFDADYDGNDFSGSEFTGVFDGDGFSINNLKVDLYSDDDSINDYNRYLGLFGIIGNQAQVKNLNISKSQILGGHYSINLGVLSGLNEGVISNCTVTDSFVWAGEDSGNIGGVTGSNSGSINGCSVYLEIQTSEYSNAVGGVCGLNMDGTIVECDSYVDICGYYSVGGISGENNALITKCRSEGNIYGEEDIGGLCGVNYLGQINFSSSQTEVMGYYNLGGFCGWNCGALQNSYAEGVCGGGYPSIHVAGFCGENNYGTMSQCYSTAYVDGDYYVGGLCASDYYGTYYQCFWDIEASGIKTDAADIASDEITGKTTAEMTDPSTFDSWDTSGWDNRQCGGSYPQLNFEIIEGDYVCPCGIGMEDFAKIATVWLCEESGVDLNDDNYVDLADMSIFVQKWLNGRN